MFGMFTDNIVDLTEAGLVLKKMFTQNVVSPTKWFWTKKHIVLAINVLGGVSVQDLRVLPA